MFLLASQESRLGRHASEGVVVFRVWGLGALCLIHIYIYMYIYIFINLSLYIYIYFYYIYIGFQLCRAPDCVAGVSFRALHLGARRCF